MKKLIKVFVLLLCFALCFTFLAGCGNKDKADMVVYADQIYTANEKGEFAKAFAVKDGKFVCVGTTDEVKKYVGDNTSVYYSTFVMPSGIEAHAHFLLEQAFMQKCYIKAKNEDGTSKSKNDILKIIKKYAEDNNILDKEDASLFGYGYSQMTLTDDKQNKQYSRLDLDNLWDGEHTDIPIYIAESSLHEAWVNTTTLVNAGINLKNGDNDPITGVLRDKDGVATGVLTNEAVAYVLQNGYKKPICSDIGYQKVVKNTCDYLNSMGYTGHYDAWTNFDGSQEIYKALNAVDTANELTCFFTTSYDIPTFEYKDGKPLDEILDKVSDIREKYKSTHVDPKFVKVFADGVLETGTGFLKEPYNGIYDGCGEQIWQQDEINNIVEKANKKDFLVHIHTMGDASCSQAVQAFVNSNEKNGKQYRNSLGHCSLIDDSDYSLIKENNIGMAVNSGWLSEINEELDLYNIALGPKRAEVIYPGDILIHQGMKPAISTDRPCANGPINIFDYMATIVLGYDPSSGNQVSRRNINLSVSDAINMLTINGAWMANNENERGSIEVGKYADFIFADNSPFDCNPKLIQNIDVKSTCFEGQFVYRNN